jgi:mannitol/fructose-specific phosphotransferase system IIA component (Ntr-type)
MIGSLLTSDLVIADVESTRRDDVIGALAARLAAYHADVDGERLLVALRERERQVSTSVGDGVAVPHARLDGLDRTIVAFARSRRGIDWNAPDGLPTHFVLLVAGPPNGATPHLKILAHAARLLGGTRCRGRLHDAGDDPEALLAVLRDEEDRARAAVRAA